MLFNRGKPIDPIVESSRILQRNVTDLSRTRYSHVLCSCDGFAMEFIEQPDGCTAQSASGKLL